MNDTEDDAKYPPNTGRISDDYGSPENLKHLPEYDDDDDDDIENDSEAEEEDGYDTDDGDSKKVQKKRKLKSLLSSYEFAPRASAAGSGGRNPLSDWSEHETFILLDAWGGRFLKQGRKSLRSEEWREVAKKVSLDSKIKRTDTQCRNRLDTLKKKYKKEKMKVGETKSVTGRWVYFRKMDALLSSNQKQQGEPNNSHQSLPINGIEEMRESDDSVEGLLPSGVAKKGQTAGRDESSLKVLVDSIHKFSKMYEKIENRKTQQMLELEKMRMDFHRELEAQKRQMLERAKAEILKIHQGDYDEDL
ncbi:unnamed protein product [Cuscuta campestris]|uniref:Myb-like domain-containing protein n=1 Tax=Cuscuta campestris TaxID=132261 RepID=A0A484KNK1_9ASTE|nr:unnamed protein product [Cuscuta campestris]